MVINRYSEKIEWEFLQEDKNLLETYSIRSNYNLNNVSSCYLMRDDEYNIILDITAESMGDFQNEEPIIFVLTMKLLKFHFHA